MGKDPREFVNEMTQDGMYGQRRYSKNDVEAWQEARAGKAPETEEEKAVRENREARNFNKLLIVIGCMVVAAVIVCIIQVR